MATDREMLIDVQTNLGDIQAIIAAHLAANPVPEPTPPPIQVAAGQSLQAAYNAAPAGSTLELEPRATFGTLTAGPKEGAGPNTRITITTRGWQNVSAGMAGLLEVKQRNGEMARIVPTPGAGVGVNIPVGSGYVNLKGIAIDPITPSGDGDHIRIGWGEQTSLDGMPSHINIEQVYLKGDLNFGTRTGIEQNGADVTIEQVWADEIFYAGQDSQALGTRIGRRTDVRFCYLAGESENIIFGGARLHGGPEMTPEDWDISDVILHKPLRWKTDGKDRNVKNIFEVKFGKRITLRRALLVNNWVDGQDGRAILLTYTTNGNCPATDGLEDVLLEDLAVINSPGGVTLHGFSWQSDSYNTKRFQRGTIRHLYFHANGGTVWPLMLGNVKGLHDWTIERSTFIHGANQLLVADYGKAWEGDPPVRVNGGPMQGLALRDSVFNKPGSYGVTTNGQHYGAGLKTFCPTDVDVSRNLIGGASSTLLTNLNTCGTGNVAGDSVAINAISTTTAFTEPAPGVGADPLRVNPVLAWMAYLPEP